MDTFDQLVLATRNSGKVREIRSLLSDLNLELIPADALENPPDVDEDRDTLRGNAEKKARTYFDRTGLPSLADDTGLEVDALGGGPGVHTARFAGPDATPEDNKMRLLAELDGVPSAKRTARFRTAVCFVDASGTAHLFDGVCEGVITAAPRGDGGFGYDPLFQPESHSETFAEMDESAKNAISHRKRALAAFSAFLHDEMQA